MGLRPRELLLLFPARHKAQYPSHPLTRCALCLVAIGDRTVTALLADAVSGFSVLPMLRWPILASRVYQTWPPTPLLAWAEGRVDRPRRQQSSSAIEMLVHAAP